MHQAFGTPPLGDYGLSEVPGHAAHAPHEDEAKMLSTEGRPYDGTEIRIVDAVAQLGGGCTGVMTRDDNDVRRRSTRAWL